MALRCCGAGVAGAVAAALLLALGAMVGEAWLLPRGGLSNQLHTVQVRLLKTLACSMALGCAAVFAQELKVALLTVACLGRMPNGDGDGYGSDRPDDPDDLGRLASNQVLFVPFLLVS